MYKILIVAPAWVGDMVMSQTLLKLLKKKYAENCQIDVLVNNWAFDVVRRMPEVSDVYINPFKHGEFGLLKRIKLGFSLRKNNYDQAFVLPNSLKSAIIPFFANIAKRTGFVGEMRYGLLNNTYKLDKLALPLMIDRFCALANLGKTPNAIDYPNFNINKTNQQNTISKFKLNLDKPIISLCPAAEYGPAKRWSPAYFAKLADYLQELGYQVWIFGSNKDVDIANEIMAQSTNIENITNFCGQTNLVEVIDLLALSNVVVSNDSGLMHIACAVNVPVIAIYGSSSPDFTPPLSKQSKIIKTSIDCSPCFARTCKFGHYNCLKQITPENVLNEIKAL